MIATDASPAMLELAGGIVPEAESIVQLTLPNDPIPRADAIVSVGHVLSYLPDEEAIDRALVAVASALNVGGVLAIDLCDLGYHEARRGDTSRGWFGEDWALVTEFSTPSPTRFVRDMVTFIRDDDGCWRRDDERHVNVLVDTARIPALLANYGVEAVVGNSFGDVRLGVGLHSIVGYRKQGIPR